MNPQSVKILFWLLFLSLTAQAQLLWHEGQVTLITGVKLKGELCYQPQADALLFRTTSQWKTYTADQLTRFQYSDVSINRVRLFAVYAVTQSTGETRPIIFEEIVPKARVPLLQLPVWHSPQWLARMGLPPTRLADWRTEQAWFVWLRDEPVALDTFMETEFDELVAAAPEAVQQWAVRFPRPADPQALARWLCYFNSRVTLAQHRPDATVAALAAPY